MRTRAKILESEKTTEEKVFQGRRRVKTNQLQKAYITFP